MKKVLTTERIPVKLWLDDIEAGALGQAMDLANLPFAYKHVAIMPDSHQGYGMPIGGVLATKGAIIPNAVGVDIGCGMCAVKTNLKAFHLDEDNLKRVMGQIREDVPVGFSHQSKKQNVDTIPVAETLHKDSRIFELIDDSYYQVGTLGGGNHFIEVQKDQDHNIWLMIHSGSRNVGYKTANYYHEKAKELCNMWESNIPNKDLSFFPREHDLYSRYWEDMQWCVDFAKANRDLMMYRVKEALYDNSPVEFEFEMNINKPHNYVDIENHYNKNVIVHRKGACRARKGEWVMIPGSQGTSSFIVKGKGEDKSFDSCSHGAGRTMSRTEAKKKLSVEEETKRLDDMGVLHAIRGEDDLDEAPSSYKDINKVIANQDDLIDVKYELTPMGVIKG